MWEINEGADLVCKCNNITTGKSQIEMSFCIHHKTLAGVCVWMRCGWRGECLSMMGVQSVHTCVGCVCVHIGPGVGMEGLFLPAVQIIFVSRIFYSIKSVVTFHTFLVLFCSLSHILQKIMK